MAKPHSEFWSKLLKLCQDQNIKQKKLCERIGKVGPTTFSSWKERNKFPRSLITKLATELGWNGLTEENAQKMGVELIDGEFHETKQHKPATFDKVLLSITNKYLRYLKQFELYSKDSSRVFKSLGENCIFAFSSCTTSPYEFDDQVYRAKSSKQKESQGLDLGRAIGNALLKGTLCLYIRPTETAIKDFQTNLGDQRLVFYDESLRQIDRFRENMKDLMTSGKLDQQISPSEADVILYRQVDQCYVNYSAMWMPGIGLSMVGQPERFMLKRRMILSLPNAMFGGALVCPDYELLENRFIYFLNHVVTNACEELKARKEGRTTGQIGLTIPPDEHAGAIEQFYNSYSTILRSVSSL